MTEQVPPEYCIWLVAHKTHASHLNQSFHCAKTAGGHLSYFVLLHLACTSKHRTTTARCILYPFALRGVPSLEYVRRRRHGRRRSGTQTSKVGATLKPAPFAHPHCADPWQGDISCNVALYPGVKWMSNKADTVAQDLASMTERSRLTSPPAHLV